MYATETHDGRKKFYVEITGFISPDVPVMYEPRMTKTKENAIKAVERDLKKRNAKYTFEHLKVTGRAFTYSEFYLLKNGGIIR